MEPMEVKTYSCVVKPTKNPLHEVPMQRVTKQELQLLAFIHGVEALPMDRVKYLGKRPMVMTTRLEDDTDKNGAIITRRVPVYVNSEMDEYRRLVLKYDTRVNPGRGKQYVQDCFKVVIDGFDHLMGEIDALSAVENSLEQVERDSLEGAIQTGATARNEVEERAKASAERSQVGSRVFANAGA
jgi:hypothetical protein